MVPRHAYQKNYKTHFQWKNSCIFFITQNSLEDAKTKKFCKNPQTCYINPLLKVLGKFEKANTKNIVQLTLPISEWCEKRVHDILTTVKQNFSDKNCNFSKNTNFSKHQKLLLHSQTMQLLKGWRGQLMHLKLALWNPVASQRKSSERLEFPPEV